MYKYKFYFIFYFYIVNIKNLSITLLIFLFNFFKNLCGVTRQPGATWDKPNTSHMWDSQSKVG